MERNRVMYEGKVFAHHSISIVRHYRMSELNEMSVSFLNSMFFLSLLPCFPFVMIGLLSFVHSFFLFLTHLI